MGVGQILEILLKVNIPLFIFYFSKILSIYFREGEQAGRGREREKESKTSSALSAEIDMGLDPTTVRPRPEQKPRVRCPTHCTTQAPQKVNIPFKREGWNLTQLAFFLQIPYYRD